MPPAPQPVPEDAWTVVSCIRDTQRLSSTYVCRRKRQLVLRSSFSLNVSIENCMHLALEPSELRLWLHFLSDVTPASTGEDHWNWQTKPGFPYGGMRFTMQHSPTTRSSTDPADTPFVRDEKAANFCAEFVPVPWCNTKGDALLSLPKMSCYVTPGADGRAWWVLVSEFSMTGILSTLPGSKAYDFLRSYATYQMQTSLKRLQTRASLLAAGMVPSRWNVGLGQMTTQADCNPDARMPSFSLLDETLVRSVVFVDEKQPPRRWDVVEELNNRAQDVLYDVLKLGTQVPAMEPAVRSGEVTENAPGTLTPVMSALFERCLSNI